MNSPAHFADAVPVTVLLIEDEPIYHDFFISALQAMPSRFDLRIARCGTEALDFIKNSDHAFSILLVDIGLPDMNGLEIIQYCRNQSYSAPSLVVSSYADEAHVLQAIRAGAQGYLNKNDTHLDICSSILKTIQGEYLLSPGLARHIFQFIAPPSTQTQQSTEASLAAKELELLTLLAKGSSYKKAALQMNVSLSTIQTYIRNIYRKLQAHSKVEALSNARKLGLIR